MHKYKFITIHNEETIIEANVIRDAIIKYEKYYGKNLNLVESIVKQ